MDRTTIGWANGIVAALRAFRVPPDKQPVPLQFLPVHPAQDQIPVASPIRKHYDELAAHVASFNSGTMRIAGFTMPEQAHQVPKADWDNYETGMRQRATKVITAAQRD